MQRKIIWSPESELDLIRIYEFWEPKNINVAERTINVIQESPSILLDQPQIAQQLTKYNPREVRKLIARDTKKKHILRLLRTYRRKNYHSPRVSRKRRPIKP